MEAIKDTNADVKLIGDTHGHWDHIGANVDSAADWCKDSDS